MDFLVICSSVVSQTASSSEVVASTVVMGSVVSWSSSSDADDVDESESDAESDELSEFDSDEAELRCATWSAMSADNARDRLSSGTVVASGLTWGDGFGAKTLGNPSLDQFPNLVR